MVLMSARRGVLVRVSGSSVKSAAGISVRHAFFAPLIAISPFSGVPPRTAILSMTSSPRRTPANVM